uniref:Retrotransposon protein, putative, Ty3-gypsy subclass n=1 Tax=Oryza brachyantha TaxID=4533 RepID=J3LIX3_ORYBR
MGEGGRDKHSGGDVVPLGHGGGWAQSGRGKRRRSESRLGLDVKGRAGLSGRPGPGGERGGGRGEEGKEWASRLRAGLRGGGRRKGKEEERIGLRPNSENEKKKEIKEKEGKNRVAAIHDVFHVSQLKKCLRVPEEQANLEHLEIHEDMTYVEKPARILETSERKTRNRVIRFCRVRQSHHSEE